MAPESDEAASESPEGVFGNLPSTRPGTRSPRRRSTADSAEPEVAKAATPAEPKAKPKPKPRAKQPEPEASPERPADPLEPSTGIHGVEDLAWAGIAVAAQAATAGVKFASRALEAARKSIDRP
jgi:hypothetical protein